MQHGWFRWDQENEDVVYVTRSLVTTTRPDGQEVCALNLHTGAITSLNYGEAAHYQKGKSWTLIGRHTRDNHVREWKHYKGGNIGQLWVENGEVTGNRFVRICESYNVSTPLLYEYGQKNCKIYFVADPKDDEPGNLFEVKNFTDISQIEVRQITFHTDYYVRNPQICSKSKTIVYQCGGDLYTLSLDENDSEYKQTKLTFQWRGNGQGKLKRMLEDPMEFFDSIDLHPSGHLVSMTIRGKLLEGALFEGPLVQKGVDTGRVRYSLARYLRDGRIVCVSLDSSFENQDVSSVLQIFDSFDTTWGQAIDNEYDGKELPQLLSDDDDQERDEANDNKDPKLARPFASPYRLSFKGKGNNAKVQGLGTVIDLVPSIKDDLFVVLNHRLELIVVRYGDVKSGSYPFKSGKNGAKKKTKGRKDFPSFQVIDKGNFEDGISDISFSPCGLYVTYTFQTSRSTSIIRIANVYTGKTFDITKQSEFCDHTPAFDPDGRYIYFISDRQYRPVDDEVWGSISIPTTDVLMLVLLQNNLPSPFLRCPMRPGAADDSESDSTDASESGSGSSEEDSSGDDSDSSDDSDDSRDYSKRGKGVERTNLDEVPMRKRMTMMIFQSNHLKFIWLALKTV